MTWRRLVECIGDQGDAVTADEGTGGAREVDGAAHALEGVEQHQRGWGTDGVSTRGGAQGFEGGFDEARPRVDEAVAGDSRFESVLEAGDVVGENDGT